MTQIKLRRDTAANFTSKNPVLGVGEPAYETDTKKLKIGDGTTAYNGLPYFSMTDEFATYREKYGAPSDSVPVVNTGNSITIKAGVSIETPNGTLTNATDMTYTYDFSTDRVLFVTENDYYHAYAVYYGGREPSPAGEQIFWFNNNVWTMISGNGTKTVFNTQKITPIAKIYQVNGTVKNIDYSSYTINSPSIDGDWIYKTLTFADSVSLPINTEGSGGVFTYDLSNYLPNDGYKYEVTISVEVNNSSFCTLGYYLPDNSWYSFAKGGNPVGGWFNAIVDSSRQVKISVVNTQEALMWAKAVAYRRLGKKV